MPETCPTCGQPWPNAMQPTDAIYWKRSGVTWNKLIGMGSAITPYHIVGAYHANILPGSTVEFPNGERAVVMKRLSRFTKSSESGTKVKKEAICALLDRPVRSFCAPYIWDEPVTFRAGSYYAYASIQSTTYIGANGSQTGGTLENPRVTDHAAVLSIRRLGEFGQAKSYDPADPILFYSTITGAFDGKSGMSGGPSAIDGKIASVHWTRASDDFIGCRTLLDFWRDQTPPIINGWTINKGGDLTMVDDGIEFRKIGKNDFALTQPSNDEARCAGSILQFAATGGDDINLQYSFMMKFDKDGDGDLDRVKAKLLFHRHRTDPGTVTLREGANIHVSLGDAPTALVNFNVVHEATTHFGAEVIGLGELQLRASGRVQGARLVN